MKKVLFCTAFFVSAVAIGQTTSPEEASRKVVEESWAKAQKEKSINDEKVREQRAAERAQQERDRDKALDKLFDKVDADKPKKSGSVTPQ